MAELDVQLTARGEQVNQPWIWRLSRDFNVRVSISKANIDTDFGFMQIHMDGPLEEIQRATAWLMTTGLHVDSLQRSLGAV